MEDQFHVLKAKIHRAVVTQAELDYEGSITVDRVLLEATGMFPFEKVLVTNLRNGSRIETYILPGEEHTGIICLNGPSAHFFQPGDEIIIMAFKITGEAGAKNARPVVIFPRNANRTFILAAPAS